MGAVAPFTIVEHLRNEKVSNVILSTVAILCDFLTQNESCPYWHAFTFTCSASKAATKVAVIESDSVNRFIR